MRLVRLEGGGNAPQPTLSNAVSPLEAELGARIFRRNTRSVEPTPFGAHIPPYLEAVLDAHIVSRVPAPVAGRG